MKSLFEYTDHLKQPYECFPCDSRTMLFPVHPHWHYFMEIIYVKQGTALISQNQDSFIVNEGDLILFLPSTVHAIYTTSPAPLQYDVLKFDPYQLGDVASSGLLGSLNFSIIFTNLIHNAHANTHFTPEQLADIPVAPIFSECIAEVSAHQYGYQTIIQAKIKELLTKLLRIWRKHGFDTDQFFAPLPENSSIYNITEYIDKHACEDLRVEKIAELCNMSYSYFAKNFREIYGQSCKKYIEFIRLCKVEDMLLFTNFDLTYISQETGFADCSHLIKSFKRKNNVTPHQYRQHNVPHQSD